MSHTKRQNGTNKPRWTQHHQVHKSPRVQLRFTVETAVYRVTEVSRCKQQREIPRADAVRITLSGLQAAYLHLRKPPFQHSSVLVVVMCTHLVRNTFFQITQGIQWSNTDLRIYSFKNHLSHLQRPTGSRSSVCLILYCARSYHCSMEG